MPLSRAYEDREYEKFDLNSSGETAVRTISEGDFSISGLRNGMRITTMEVSNVAVPLPALPLADRNSIIIFNLDETKTLYIGNSDVEANENIGIKAGWQLGPRSYYSTDVTDNIIFYGVVDSGTIKIQVKEIS
jgi:hypothetical protein